MDWRFSPFLCLLFPLRITIPMFKYRLLRDNIGFACALISATEKIKFRRL
ncbi:hypothetical protein NB716_001274 [Pantoea ananatis]|nr:hypothetical protein [Pantoea ananatis]